MRLRGVYQSAEGWARNHPLASAPLKGGIAAVTFKVLPVLGGIVVIAGGVLYSVRTALVWAAVAIVVSVALSFDAGRREARRAGLPLRFAWQYVAIIGTASPTVLGGAFLLGRIIEAVFGLPFMVSYIFGMLPLSLGIPIFLRWAEEKWPSPFSRTWWDLY